MTPLPGRTRIVVKFVVPTTVVETEFFSAPYVPPSEQCQHRHFGIGPDRNHGQVRGAAVIQEPTHVPVTLRVDVGGRDADHRVLAHRDQVVHLIERLLRQPSQRFVASHDVTGVLANEPAGFNRVQTAYPQAFAVVALAHTQAHLHTVLHLPVPAEVATRAHGVAFEHWRRRRARVEVSGEVLQHSGTGSWTGGVVRSEPLQARATVSAALNGACATLVARDTRIQFALWRRDVCRRVLNKASRIRVLPWPTPATRVVATFRNAGALTKFWFRVLLSIVQVLRKRWRSLLIDSL